MAEEETQATPSQLRDAAEIQYAHDLLVQLLLSEEETRREVITENMDRTIDNMACVLCWCLHHDHNEDFPTLMRMIEERLAALGIVMLEGPPDEEAEAL